jgi:hypothetical protein
VFPIMRLRRSFLAGSLSSALAGCGGDGTPVTPTAVPVVVGTQIVSRSTTAGVPVSIDLADAFVDQKHQGLTYSVSYSPAVATLSLTAGEYETL